MIFVTGDACVKNPGIKKFWLNAKMVLVIEMMIVGTMVMMVMMIVIEMMTCIIYNRRDPTGEDEDDASADESHPKLPPTSFAVVLHFSEIMMVAIVVMLNVDDGCR